LAVGSTRSLVRVEGLPDLRFRSRRSALCERCWWPPLRQVAALAWPEPSPSAAAASRCHVHPLPTHGRGLRPTSAPPNSMHAGQTVPSASPRSTGSTDPYVSCAGLRHIAAQSKKDVLDVSELQHSPRTAA